MRSNNYKSVLKHAGLAATALLLASGVAFGQQTVNLSVGPATAIQPDGTAVPMWGYTCGTAVTGSTATCTALNPAVQTFNTNPATPVASVGSLWSPVVITVPTGQDLTISLTNSLTFAGGNIPTSLVIVGQLGGGLGTTAGTAYGTGATAVTYNADIPLLLSEIDPVQNLAVGKAVGTVGFSETNVWSGLYGGCGNPWNADGTANTTTYGTCYPPAVNYTPLYYLFNGRAFDKTNSSASLFAAAPGSSSAPVSGTVLVRLVNAGLRMHVPSIVGAQTGVAVAPATTPPSGFSLIAEDGNVLPGVARVQSEVFMPAGKTNDVMINVPSVTTALPIFDRELSLSANSIARDAGMLAYISVNGAALPTGGAFSAAATTAVANPDSYYLVGGKTLVVLDVGKGVVANDVNVNGVQVLAAPSAGTLALNPDGTFSYVPNSGTTS